tara:strand:- start:19415 stop:19684 length:270 start_codon:yes stop_codon:yes gene_type:complete
MSKIKPLDNRLVVIVDEVKEKTDSGILLSAENQKKQCRGVVMSIGPKIEDIKIGDYIMFPEYAGTIVYSDGEEYLILRETEIMGILEDE